jgi:hypothetical protein
MERAETPTGDGPLEPEDPADAGVAERTPDDSRIEGAHVLAGQARPHLEDRGFSEDQVIRWADAFIAEHGHGDVALFLDWIAQQEHGPQDGREGRGA